MFVSHNLDEAREYSDSLMIMEGDWGGVVYIECPVRMILCSEERLRELLDAVSGPDEGLSIYYVRAEDSIFSRARIYGVQVEQDVWVDKESVELYVDIKLVLTNKSNTQDAKAHIKSRVDEKHVEFLRKLSLKRARKPRRGIMATIQHRSLLKIILFSGYPTLCLISLIFGINVHITPIISAISFVCFFGISMLIFISSLKKWNNVSILMLSMPALTFPMLEQVHNLYFLAGLLFSIIVGYIILKNLEVGSLILKISNPRKDARLLLACWSILIVSGSIITSNILSRLKYSINVIPLLFLGIIFGWFSPETTYKIVDGKNHEIKSMALPLLFSFLLLLYNAVLDMTPNLEYLTADGNILNMVVFIFILNMILSRTVFEFIIEPIEFSFLKEENIR